MSSEFERRLRDAREVLPDPDAAATERARERALAAVRRRRPGGRAAAVVAIALVVAVALGTGLGTLLAPSGTAASGPLGTGFLPEPGWTVLQSGADATPERQALALASNVPLHPEDSARGIRASSGLPYETLLRLPQRGVVIVALFTRRGPYAWQDELYPRRELPLRVDDAARSQFYSVPVRPERPLGQYQFQATVNDHYVDLYFYFGTPAPSPVLIAAAQEQLDRLIVGSLTATDARAARRLGGADLSASRLIDRTFLCEAGVTGGIREIEVQADPPIRTLDRSAAVQAVTGAYDSLGWTSEYGVRLNARCKSAPPIPLTSRGLTGGTSTYAEQFDCTVGRNVLVRIRAVFGAPVKLKRVRGFLEADGAVREGELAVRTQSGKPLAYGKFVASKRTRLFVAGTCVRDPNRW